MGWTLKKWLAIILDEGEREGYECDEKSFPR